ncbi:5017_t:CDS:10 [Entrophospora sp. SA101]|nr:10402_t:CDS:10 [Entrophospora sp. SA101]CAJ0872619.1 5017_t:CDS:10 [Entrophospora sp. SA101]
MATFSERIKNLESRVEKLLVVLETAEKELDQIETEKQRQINHLLTEYNEELEKLDKMLSDERTHFRLVRNKLINKLYLAEKLGGQKPTKGNGNGTGSDPSGTEERKEIKLKRMVKFAHFEENGTLSDEADRIWVFTGYTDHNFPHKALQHYNQFAMVEIDNVEYMVRWHKQFANSYVYEGDEKVFSLDGLPEAFAPLIGKNERRYMERVGEGTRCLLTELDLGKPPVKSKTSSNGGSNNSNSSGGSGDNGNSENKDIHLPKAEEKEIDDENKPKTNLVKNPSKTLLINYKVVNIYKLSDMKKLGKQLFRTKTSSGATIGGGLGAAVVGLFAILGAPITLGAIGAITGEEENLANRGGIEFGVDSGKGLTDKSYQAEYTIDEGKSGAKELCEDPRTKKYGRSANGKFILNPDPKSVSANIAKHYKEKHCYFNFQSYGDDFAQYYGITPLNNNPAKYGIKWQVDFTHYVVAYIGGKLLSQSAIATATASGQKGVDAAQAYGEKMAARKYKDSGRLYVNAAQATMDERVSLAQTTAGLRAGSQMTRAVGRSFAGATRLFGGGKGSYTSGINEFIQNKAHFPPLHFYFGDDPELAEKKDFGKCQGTGRQVFANAHASPNPLIDYMTGNSVFIYQKCCGKQPHEKTCKRPRLTLDDFFSGFEYNSTNKIPLGNGIGSAGAYVNTVAGGVARNGKLMGQELEFGKGDESYNYLITRYALTEPNAETIQVKKTESRDNPPDSFGGGGGTDVNIPSSSASLKEELGGMTVSLPQVLGQGVVMPESIQSMLNTDDVKVDLETPEMPQMEGLKEGQQQQEQIFQNIGTGEQNLNTERGGVPAEKTKDKEKIGENEYWQNLIENNPLYAQLFIEEEVDLDKLPTGTPTSPPPPVKEELRSLKESKDLAELQLKQEKEQKELAEQQKKADLELKDKEIKDLNEKIDKERENYAKLQSFIKTSGTEAGKYKAIIEANNQKIKELGIAEKQAKSDLVKKEEEINLLRSQKDKELLVKQQKIELLELTGKNLTTDQQSLIDKHQKDLIQLQELHQEELAKKNRVYEFTCETISKADKEVKKIIEVYDRTFEIEEEINENPITPSEKAECKGTVKEVFVKSTIKALKDSYLDSHEQLRELQKFVNNKKSLLVDNPNLLKYLNGWEKLEVLVSKKDTLKHTIQSRLDEFGLTKQQFDDYLQATIESEKDFEELEEQLLSALTEFFVYYYTETGYFENKGTKNKEALQKYVAKYRTEIDLKVYKNSKDLLNKVIKLEEIKTQILLILDGKGEVQSKGIDNYFSELKGKLADLGDSEQQKAYFDNLLSEIKPDSEVNVEVSLRYNDIKKKVNELLGEKLTGKLTFQAQEIKFILPSSPKMLINRQIEIKLKSNSLASEGFTLKETGQRLLRLRLGNQKDENIYKFLQKELTDKIDVKITLNILDSHKIDYREEAGAKNRPTTLQAVIDKGKQIRQEKGDPLAGIDLKGAEYNKLTTGAFGQNTNAVNELKEIKGKMARFSQADEKHPKHYRVLEAGKDGNCYLNSMANLLTGEKSREKEVAIKLRVRLILELMTNQDIMEHIYPLNEISSFNVSDGEIKLTRNKAYMSNDDVKYFVPFLKRPITIIYPAEGAALNNQDAQETGEFKGFSRTTQPFLEELNPKLTEQKAIRIYFSSDICDAGNIGTPDGIRVDNGEIHLDEANVEDVILVKGSAISPHSSPLKLNSINIVRKFAKIRISTSDKQTQTDLTSQQIAELMEFKAQIQAIAKKD